MTRRLLMICYHFPPLGGIASVRALRFASRLPGFGWETLVLTPERGEYFRDASLRFPPERTRRTFNLELSRAARGVLRLEAGAAGELPKASLLGRLRDLTHRFVYRPDAQVGWYPFALTAARRLLREKRVDALFSSSYPMTGHLIARRLRRETGLPWVADFRDLWGEWSQATGWRRRRDHAFEQSILDEAACVTSVSPTYAEVFSRRGARRVEVLTNAFDEEEVAETEPVEPATFAYLGTYYPGFQGHLETALRALAGLFAAGRLPGLRLRFVGPAPARLERAFEDLGLAARTEATGFLPHAAAVRALRRAGVLFFAGPHACDRPERRGNVAAKVFEYLGARRPILMVGHPDSDVARFLRPFPRARVVPAGAVEEAGRAILELLAWRGGDDEAALEPYTSRSVTRRLAALLDSL